MVGLRASLSVPTTVGGVRSGGFARGIRVVVEIVWMVYSGAGDGSGSLMVRGWVGVGCSSATDSLSSSVRVGLCGASKRERRDVLTSETIAGAGGSQEGVRAWES